MIDVICNDCLGILSDKVIIYSSYDMYYDRLLCVKFNLKLYLQIHAFCERCYFWANYFLFNGGINICSC
jgi:hypothetical protein